MPKREKDARLIWGSTPQLPLKPMLMATPLTVEGDIWGVSWNHR